MPLFSKKQKEEIIDLRDVSDIVPPKKHQIVWANKNNIPLTKKNHASNSSGNFSSSNNAKIEELSNQIALLTNKIRMIEMKLNMNNGDETNNNLDYEDYGNNGNYGGGVDDTPFLSNALCKNKERDITEDFASSGQQINFF